MADNTHPLVRGEGAAAVSAMVPNAFIGRTERPTDADLATALGPVKPVWDGLLADLAAKHGVTVQEWSSYSLKAGWSLRLKRGKRTIVWMAPCEACFRVAFILGDKALLAARQSGLSARALRALDEAERYPEGTGVRLLINGPADIPTVKKLAVVKLEN
jgi:Protein of unknown function (DUF3788)